MEQQEYIARLKKEIPAFGVEVDLEDPCHNWSNSDLEIQKSCVSAIENKYQGRKGEIIFYGPSNIQMWYSLEKDMLPYRAQNHGMGGCVDEEMMLYAERMLYRFDPSIVFFQTGSNDLALGFTLEQILDNKRKMYAEYRKHMKETKLVVMSGLPLPGRQQFWEDTVKVNQMLREMCQENENMYFMDASNLLTSEMGREDMRCFDGRYFVPEYYIFDGIHLNKKGHDVWTSCMKKILQEELLEEV